MGRSKFYINFKSRPDLNRIQFKSEPVGFDAADFGIVQEDGRMGVDTLFAGGTGKFQFSKMAHPEIFEHLQNTIDLQGFEAVADLEIDYNSTGEIIIIGNLDFFTSDNNTYGLIAIDVILGEEFTRIKKNIEANVNVFSSLDIMGNVIQPVQKKKILLKALPLTQLSNWESTADPVNALAYVSRSSVDTPYNVTRVGANNGNVLKASGIDNTLSFIAPQTALNNANGGIPNLETFTYVEFLDNATNVRIKITEINGYSVQQVIQQLLGSAQVLTGNGKTAIEVRVGFDMQTADVYTLWSKTHNYVKPFIGVDVESQKTFFPPELSLNIPFVERNKRIWIYVNPNASATFSEGSGVLSTYQIFAPLTSWKIEIGATLRSYPTVNDGLRLIDVVKQVAKSAGLADVSFPRAEQGGYLYDQFIFDGNLLRNLEDKPFNITWKYITEWFPEQNIDYEIQSDGSIFIGNDEDFYRNSEMYVCDKMADIGLKDNFNPEFGLNLFELNFQNYQSQKENDTANTFDGVHGESQWKTPNINVTGTKEVKVNASRDPFSLEAVRVKAFKTPPSTATQDDDKKFMVDVFPKNRISETEFMFTETDLLKQEFNDETQLLTLTNSGTFNWILLGIKVGYRFRILANPTPFNSGLWNVEEVGYNYIVLSIVGNNNPSSLNNAERYTTFQYFISTSDIDGIGWTNEDFTQIEGILNAQNFGNLRFTVGRNIKNWEHHLATANLYHSEKPFINTLYKNNPNLITTLYGVTLKEGADFIPKNPLLSTKLVTLVFKMRFDDYYKLMSDVRSYRRGFIRAFDAFGNPIKLYVKDMRYKQTASTLGDVTLIGKKKHDPAIVNIDTNQGTNFISLNNNEYLVQRLRYEIKDNYFYIKDQNGRLMYKRLTFKQIAFNGTSAQTQSQLINWLNPISEQ